MEQDFQKVKAQLMNISDEEFEALKFSPRKDFNDGN